jgi:hypothetical protein
LKRFITWQAHEGKQYHPDLHGMFEYHEGRIQMDDELRKIEIETARIRLERERLALQDEINKRNLNDRVANVAQNAINRTRDIGVSAVDTSTSVLKYAFAAFFGAAGTGAIAGIWILATKSSWDIRKFAFDFGFWAGSGGWILLLVGGLIGIYLARPSDQRGPVGGFMQGFKDGIRDGNKDVAKTDERLPRQDIKNVRSNYGPIGAIIFVLWKHLGWYVVGALVVYFLMTFR